MRQFKGRNKALFSVDKRYRYYLRRTWDAKGKIALLIGLNPSKANSNEEDNTTKKLRKILNHNGYGGYVLINLYAIVSTDSDALVDKDFDEIRGPSNRRWLFEFDHMSNVIFMWGCKERLVCNQWVEYIKRKFPNAKCFKKSIDGHPVHPLFLSDETRLINYG